MIPEDMKEMFQEVVAFSEQEPMSETEALEKVLRGTEDPTLQEFIRGVIFLEHLWSVERADHNCRRDYDPLIQCAQCTLIAYIGFFEECLTSQPWAAEIIRWLFAAVARLMPEE